MIKNDNSQKKKTNDDGHNRKHSYKTDHAKYMMIKRVMKNDKQKTAAERDGDGDGDGDGDVM